MPLFVELPINAISAF